MSEQSVGGRELKMRLSEYLRRVKTGATIVITEFGQPVGRIVPAERDCRDDRGPDRAHFTGRPGLYGITRGELLWKIEQ